MHNLKYCFMVRNFGKHLSKKRNEQRGGECIFKEETDMLEHVGVSDEHLWPQWLSEMLGHREGDGKNHTHRYSTIDNDLKSGIVRLEEFYSKHRGPRNTRRLRIVCKECNSRWMSGIENSVKPVIADLLSENKTSLTVIEQLLICRWMVLKTMIAEYTDYQGRVISVTDRMYFKNTQADSPGIPPGWRIWIGEYLGGDPQWQQRYIHSGHKIARNLEEAKEFVPLNTQATIFVFGNVFLYAMSSSLGELINSWNPSPTLVQIWPPSGVEIDWPPYLPITSDEAGQISALLKDFLLAKSRPRAVLVDPVVHLVDSRAKPGV